MYDAMAMQWPYARIVRVPFHHEVRRNIRRTSRHKLRVASLRVLRIGDCPIPFTHSLCQDPEVMPMQMHGVNQRRIVPDDETDRGAVPKVVDIPLRIVGVGGVTRIREEQKWVTA